MKTTRHIRGLSVFCNLMVPGLGHFLLGHGRRGLRWYATCLAATLAGVVGFAWSPAAMWTGIAMTMLAYAACVSDALRLSPAASLPGTLSLLAATAVAAIPADMIEHALRRDVGETIHVTTANMSPTLAMDDHVVVRKFGPAPSLGQVVVYRSPFDPTSRRVGRVVGVAGDRLAFEDSLLVRNGEPVESRAGTGEPEPNEREDAMTALLGFRSLVVEEHLGDRRYTAHTPLGAEMVLAEQVPEGHVYVLSDDRSDEWDSRIYGSIPSYAIVGIASFVYYAADEAGIRWDRINRRIS